MKIIRGNLKSLASLLKMNTERSKILPTTPLGQQKKRLLHEYVNAQPLRHENISFMRTVS